jgi:hypothetical protein
MGETQSTSCMSAVWAKPNAGVLVRHVASVHLRPCDIQTLRALCGLNAKVSNGDGARFVARNDAAAGRLWQELQRCDTLRVGPPDAVTTFEFTSETPLTWHATKGLRHSGRAYS